MQRTLFALALCFICARGVMAEDAPDANKSDKGDNSSRNTRERDAAEKNPADQKGTPADIAITQKIRRALMDDKDLSTYAHNIKIITQDGMVNLKGPVRTTEEKKSCEDKAVAVVGVEKVKSQLEVAPKQ